MHVSIKISSRLLPVLAVGHEPAPVKEVSRTLSGMQESRYSDPREHTDVHDQNESSFNFNWVQEARSARSSVAEGCILQSRTCYIVRGALIIVPLTPEVCDEHLNSKAVRKLLDSRGWDRAWIDGVTERVSRTQVQPSVAHMGAVLDAVEEVGLKGAQVEHAFTLAWSLWNRTPEQITAVAEYLKSIGAKDPAKILFHNPKLLEYDVSADGSELESGPRARAKVTFSTNGDGEEVVLVSFYSTTAKFNTAPLSPYQP